MNKIALITGASSGMGKYFALYAKKYFKDIDEVWLIGRNIKRLSKVALNLNVKSKIFAIDITNSNEIEVLKNNLEEFNPDIKLLVNCAGVGYIGNISDISTEDNLVAISTNCMALVEITKLALPYMIKDSYIINLASSAAFIPQPGFATYAASKSFVYSFSEALGLEIKKQRIHVTTVCPGSVKTNFIKNAEKYNSIKWFKKLVMANEKKVVIKAYNDTISLKTRSIYGVPMKAFHVICKVLPHKLIYKFM